MVLHSNIIIGNYSEIVTSISAFENERLLESQRLLWRWFFDSDTLEYLICVSVEFDSANFKRKGRKRKTYESYLVAWCLSQESIHEKKINVANKSISRSVILSDAYPYYASDIKTEGAHFSVYLENARQA